MLLTPWQATVGPVGPSQFQWGQLLVSCRNSDQARLPARWPCVSPSCVLLSRRPIYFFHAVSFPAPPCRQNLLPAVVVRVRVRLRLSVCTGCHQRCSQLLEAARRVAPTWQLSFVKAIRESLPTAPSVPSPGWGRPTKHARSVRRPCPLSRLYPRSCRGAE